MTDDMSSSNQCLPPLDTLDFDEPFTSASTMTTTNFLGGFDVTLPYGEPSPTTESSSGLYSPTDSAISPAGSLLLPHPSPASSYNGLSSPGSYYSDGVCPSDIESSSPVTPDEPNPFSLTESLRRRSSASSSSRPSLHHHTSSASAVPSSHFLHAPSPSTHHRSHSMSSIQRPRSVASPAMLDANSRRRRHPASFECELCHQTFTAQFSLRRHQQSHTGERPFECSIPGCGQRFFNSSDCKRHEKSRKRHKDLFP
ncbi:hypothetical protein F5I97DRAFT_1440897 [Phlebopus sp. FC_14]|nr:hypothetical protein F5I97DRAFT_1440897 [Phlebopus sp. FC_14]